MFRNTCGLPLEKLDLRPSWNRMLEMRLAGDSPVNEAERAWPTEAGDPRSPISRSGTRADADRQSAMSCVAAAVVGAVENGDLAFVGVDCTPGEAKPPRRRCVTAPACAYSEIVCFPVGVITVSVSVPASLPRPLSPLSLDMHSSSHSPSSSEKDFSDWSLNAILAWNAAMRSVSFVTSPAADARSDPLVSLLISLGCDGARFAVAESARGIAAAKNACFPSSPSGLPSIITTSVRPRAQSACVSLSLHWSRRSGSSVNLRVMVRSSTHACTLSTCISNTYFLQSQRSVEPSCDSWKKRHRPDRPNPNGRRLFDIVDIDEAFLPYASWDGNFNSQLPRMSGTSADGTRTVDPTPLRPLRPPVGRTDSAPWALAAAFRLFNLSRLCSLS